MIKKLLAFPLALVATVAALSGCATLTVTSDVNTTVGTQCHSFAWAGSFKPRSGPLKDVVNPVNESRLRTAIANNLNGRGVTLAASPATADCLVGYGIGVHDVIEGAYPWGYGWGGGWGWRHGYGAGWWDEPYVFQEGIIAVDLYDAKTHQPLWHASVNQNVTRLTGAAAEAKINEAVTAIFTKYPR
jgi:hypothetical protein